MQTHPRALDLIHTQVSKGRSKQGLQKASLQLGDFYSQVTGAYHDGRRWPSSCCILRERLMVMVETREDTPKSHYLVCWLGHAQARVRCLCFCGLIPLSPFEPVGRQKTSDGPMFAELLPNTGHCFEFQDEQIRLCPSRTLLSMAEERQTNKNNIKLTMSQSKHKRCAPEVREKKPFIPYGVLVCGDRDKRLVNSCQFCGDVLEDLLETNLGAVRLLMRKSEIHTNSHT